jgi:hypothetical protein
MKFATERPLANPEATARKLVEIANSVEAVQDGGRSPSQTGCRPELINLL